MKFINKILLILIILNYALQAKISNKFTLNFQKVAQDNHPQKNAKVIYEDWIHYIKYVEGSDIPNMFFRNPSFETQVKYEDVDKNIDKVNKFLNNFN